MKGHVVTKIELHVHVHEGADEHRVELLEEKVMTVASELEALTAAVTEFNEDIAAKVAALESAQGEFTVEGRAAFDTLKATVDAGVTAVGDADEDGNPPPVVPVP